jgi:hypothetical protein
LLLANDRDDLSVDEHVVQSLLDLRLVVAELDDNTPSAASCPTGWVSWPSGSQSSMRISLIRRPVRATSIMICSFVEPAVLFCCSEQVEVGHDLGRASSIQLHEKRISYTVIKRSTRSTGGNFLLTTLMLIVSDVVPYMPDPLFWGG